MKNSEYENTLFNFIEEGKTLSSINGREARCPIYLSKIKYWSRGEFLYSFLIVLFFNCFV
jgi:hypothetical protein